jgi:hypothetical protein
LPAWLTLLTIRQRKQVSARISERAQLGAALHADRAGERPRPARTFAIDIHDLIFRLGQSNDHNSNRHYHNQPSENSPIGNHLLHLYPTERKEKNPGKRTGALVHTDRDG